MPIDLFQSQTRSQPPCDASRLCQAARCIICFNLRREASPLATLHPSKPAMILTAVSISDEKPAPLRQKGRAADYRLDTVSISDEKPAPLRRSRIWRRCTSLMVSISDEKPAPLRRPKKGS